jgi:hypothetical protein
LFLIGLAVYGVLFHLLWNLLATPARGDEFSPCRMPDGRPVACQHFLSSSPDQMRIRDEWLKMKIRRDPRDQRRDERKQDGH